MLVCRPLSIVLSSKSNCKFKVITDILARRFVSTSALDCQISQDSSYDISFLLKYISSTKRIKLMNVCKNHTQSPCQNLTGVAEKCYEQVIWFADTQALGYFSTQFSIWILYFSETKIPPVYHLLPFSLPICLSI